MKKTFRLLLAIAAAAISAIGCQTSEVEQATGSTVHFRALDIATKTTFGTPSAGSLPTLWQEGDRVKLYVNYSVNGSTNAVVTPSADGTTASFSASLSSTANDIAITAVSPLSAAIGASTSYKSITIEIPTTQTATATSPDPAAQLLYASATGYTEMPSSVDVTFHHITAYAKMSISNLDCGDETVTAVTIKSSKNIAGRWFFYPEGNDDKSAGELEDNSASNTIMVNTSSLSNIWFALAPVSVDGASFKISVSTTGGNYSKTINFTGRSFQAGHVASFNVDMAGVTKESNVVFTKVTDVSSLTVGKEVIIVAANADYAMSTTQSKNNRAIASVKKSGDMIADPSSAVQVLTIEAGASAGTIAFSTGSGYLFAPGAGNYLRTQDSVDGNASWNVTISGSEATIKNVANATYAIKYNSAGSIFSCYTTAQNPVSIYAKDASAIRKTSQALSFSQTSYEVDLNGSFTEPVLSGAHTAVTYSSSDTDVATVNANSGAVTIVGLGTTTITAVAAEDATYYAGVASYTITVNAPASTIASVAAGVESKVEGQVAAICTKGFVLADATGAIFVYKTVSGLTIGQTVTVEGTPTEYNTGLQFPAASVVTLGATGTFAYPTASTLDSSAASAFLGRQGENLAQYVTFSGEVAGSSSRDVILAGDTDAQVTGYNMTDAIAALMAGALEVTVKGYACFTSSKMVAVIVTEVVQTITKPVLPASIDFPQSGNYSGTTNYPLSSFTTSSIQNYSSDWAISVSVDGTVFTSGSWYSGCLHYSIADNTTTSERQGWLKITLANGKYTIEKQYKLTQGVDPKLNPTGTTKTFDFKTMSELSEWNSSYAEHVVEFDVATVTFQSASKQTTTITGQPVTKDGEVSLVMTNGATLKSASFVCTQWGTKAKTITLHYSTDGGSTYKSTGVTSSIFAISSTSLPSGTNAVKITFNNASNQVGIASATVTY